MGFDSIEPFMMNPEKGVFILALTSNAGSKDVQRLRVGSKLLYEKVVRLAKKWNAKQNIGLVVGATHPKELQRIRKIVPDMPILVPGVGKQGGGLRSSLHYGCNKQGQLAVINVSRSIIYASSEKDFADAARREANKLVKEMRMYMSQ
jgi:orotidine-5'-phosphate decarboxylase